MRPWKEPAINFVLVVGFIIVGVLPLLYLLLRFFFLSAAWFVNGDQEQSLLDSTMGGLAATVFGVVIGIPVALWLNKRQEEISGKREQAKQKEELITRQKKILVLIKDELQTNREIIESRLVAAGDDPQKRKVLVGYPMKDELWHALADGGELQFIQDVDILNLIATAYNKINTTKFLETKYSEALLSSPVVLNSSSIQSSILTTLASLDRVHIMTIDFALARINEKLREDQ